MRITPDTNVLVRAVVGDDNEQANAARRCLAQADSIVFTLPALCETVWVLTSFYKATRSDIALAIRTLTGAVGAVFDEDAVAAGLRVLDAGGDFADGAIAAAGIRMGAGTFVSFDRKAVRLLIDLGLPAEAP